MRDNELILEILHQIQESARKVIQRFQTIRKPNDFTDTSNGVEKMDERYYHSSLCRYKR